MGEIAIKKKAITTVLSCFVVLVILVSALPFFVTQTNAIMPVDMYMGKITGKNNDVLTVQIEYKLDYSNPHNWVSYSATSQWTISNSNAINEIRVGDYIEIAGFLGVDNEGESICIGKMKSSTEKVITDVYGDPGYLVPVHAFIEHPGVLNPPLLGDYIITYENIPDCSKYPSGSFACNVEAKYSDVIISKGNEQLKSQRLYPGRSFKYEDKGRGYNIDITFNSGEAPAYPDCTDQRCLGPQAFSDFTIHIKKIEEKKPDLIIEDIYWQPEKPKQGDTMTFYVYIKNQGSGSAGTSTVKYYIDGTYVASDSVPAFSAGSAESTQTFTWTANKCGDVQVKAVADATNAVTESNEGNNERSETVSVTCLNHPPIAYIDSITPNPANQGETVSFSGHGTDPDGDWIGGFNWRSNIDGQLSTYLSFKTSKLSVGTHAIYFKVNDVHDVWSDEATMTLVVNEEFNWDEIIRMTKAQRDIYTTYKDHIFNDNWWYDLGSQNQEEREQAVYDAFNPAKMAVLSIAHVITVGTPVNIAVGGFEIAQMGISIFKVAIDLLSSFRYDTIGTILLGGKNAQPNFDSLINNCKETIINAKAHDVAALRSSLREEKNLIEQIYGNMQYYDRHIHSIILNNPGFTIAPLAWKEQYRIVKDQIAIFRHYLEIRYGYETYLLDGEPKKLNEISPVGLKDVELPLSPGFFFGQQKLDVLGALGNSEESDIHKVLLKKGTKINVRLQKGYSDAGGSYIPYTFKFYVKYGSVPTEKSYGWKGEKYGVIEIDKTGTYYFMVRSNGYGEYRLKVTEYPDWYPVGKPLEKELLVFRCPVHVTITDNSGRVITDTGINEIPNANIIVKGEEKIFYLPLDCTYSTEINAYDSGIFNFTRVSPIGNDIAITKFENISITASTKASVELEPGVTDYTMSIDYDGDGVTDEEKSPDVRETIEVPTPTNIIYVPDDYPTIQWAVDNATVGDTIIVRDGLYTENIDVNKPHLMIKSESGSENCIVHAANSNDHVFEVTADHVNISGFTVEGATEEAGIYLHGVDHCIISDNNVLNNDGGIYLYSSNNNVITNNYVNSNNLGILLIFSSFSNTIANNNASNNFLAIFLTYSDNNMITKNNVSNNKYGIWHIHSNNSMITENIISNSNYDGFWLDSSNNNTITKNHMLDNNNGIILNSTNNNLIYLNNFINNADNVYPTGSINIWNSTLKMTYTYNGNTYTNYLGNYWSDYGGSDINMDGIGDTLYSIDSDKDNYPLMQPYEKYFRVLAPKPTPTGSISVTSEPSGATIHLEGYAGPSVKTPFTFTDVPVGTYTLELSLDGYEDWSTNVYVRTGETSYVHGILDWLAP